MSRTSSCNWRVSKGAVARCWRRMLACIYLSYIFSIVCGVNIYPRLQKASKNEVEVKQTLLFKDVITALLFKVVT